MNLRQVSNRSFELNRNKNWIEFLRVGTFTRQDDGSILFFVKDGGDPMTSTILNDVQIAMQFLANRPEVTGEHHF